MLRGSSTKIEKAKRSSAACSCCVLSNKCDIFANIFNKDLIEKNSVCIGDINGTISFGDNSISLTFGDKAPSELYRNKSIDFVIKDQSDFLDWPDESVPGIVSLEINKYIDELEEKGWVDCRVLAHEPETNDFLIYQIFPYTERDL